MNFECESTPQAFQMLEFFSSFLGDLLNLAVGIKSHVYQLVGLQPPHFRREKVHENIYSIMDACNQSYEALRRTQTLLKGYLRGRAELSMKRESARESRISNRNPVQSQSEEYRQKQIYPHKTFQLYQAEPQVLSQFEKNTTSRSKRGQQRKNHNQSPIFEGSVRPKERKLAQSKSHGQLTTNAEPIQITQKMGQKGTATRPIELINKIRRQLGLVAQQ